MQIGVTLNLVTPLGVDSDGTGANIGAGACANIGA